MTKRLGLKGTRRTMCWPSIAMGSILAMIALTAMVVDLRNNFSFGLQYSEELALVMGLAALGLTALPAAQALLGPDPILRWGKWACIVMTVWAAVSAYADKQGQEILKRQADQAAYERAQNEISTAQQDITRASAVADGISETLTVEALQKLVAEKQSAADREGARVRCGTKCEALKQEAVSYTIRLGQAQTKRDALTRVAQAQQRLDQAKEGARHSPAEASMIASYIATRTGHSASDIARTIALTTTAFAIVTTLLMALLAHQAMALFMRGFGGKQFGQTDENEGKHRDSQKRGRKALTPEERLKKFVSEQIVFGSNAGQLTPNQLYTAFSSWWVCQVPGQPVPSSRKLSLAMSEYGWGSTKEGGRRLYKNIELPPFQTA